MGLVSFRWSHSNTINSVLTLWGNLLVKAFKSIVRSYGPETQAISSIVERGAFLPWELSLTLRYWTAHCSKPLWRAGVNRRSCLTACCFPVHICLSPDTVSFQENRSIPSKNWNVCLLKQICLSSVSPCPPNMLVPYHSDCHLENSRSSWLIPHLLVLKIVSFSEIRLQIYIIPFKDFPM